MKPCIKLSKWCNFTRLKAIDFLKIFDDDFGSIADEVTILKRHLSFGSDLLFGSNSGRETSEIISPLDMFITTAAPPTTLNSFILFCNSSLTA